MGEVIRIKDYLERKAMETDPDAIKKRLAAIALEQLLLASEKHRLESILLGK